MTNRIKNLQLVFVILLLLLLSACGSRPPVDEGGEETTAGTSRGSSSMEAMPTASFKSVGEQSNITTTIDVETEAVEEEGPDLALGERVYGNNCADCHGAAAEGTPDKGSALAGLSQPYAEFEDLIRTGGDLGPEHLFGTRAVSVNGLEAMHAYLQSLSN